MLRPIAVIIWAIRLSQPTMPDAQAQAYAKVVQVESKQRHIDPFTIVAIVHNESHWRAGAVSRDGEDYGLGQIRARFVGSCRKDADPVRKPSKACKAVKARLLSGGYNLRVVAGTITRWRSLCRKRTKRAALFHRWLAGYGGLGRPSKGQICGQKRTAKGWVDLPVHPKLQRIMRYRLRLIAKMPR